MGRDGRRYGYGLGGLVEEGDKVAEVEDEDVCPDSLGWSLYVSHDTERSSPHDISCLSPPLHHSPAPTKVSSPVPTKAPRQYLRNIRLAAISIPTYLPTYSRYLLFALEMCTYLFTKWNVSQMLPRSVYIYSCGWSPRMDNVNIYLTLSGCEDKRSFGIVPQSTWVNLPALCNSSVSSHGSW